MSNENISQPPLSFYNEKYHEKNTHPNHLVHACIDDESIWILFPICERGFTYLKHHSSG